MWCSVACVALQQAGGAVARELRLACWLVLGAEEEDNHLLTIDAAGYCCLWREREGTCVQCQRAAPFPPGVNIHALAMVR